MNPFHDDQGRFSEGDGGGAVPADRMNRFVSLAGNKDRHEWMGRTRDNARHPNAGQVHARQDQVATTAHEHQKVPAFGRRGR